MPRRAEPMFVWIPPDRSQRDWSVTIKDIDITDYINSGSFTRGLVGEECNCEIELDNSGEAYTNVFTFGDTILFKMDFIDGTTTQWKGKVESIEKQQNNSGFILRINGVHLTGGLLDVMITEEYSNTNVSDILKDLIDKYLK